MADRYYVNSSNTKETQTVYIRRNEERIILIGTQQHRPITGPKSFIGSFCSAQGELRQYKGYTQIDSDGREYYAPFITQITVYEEFEFLYE